MSPASDGDTRVWYQSFVDPDEQAPYIRRLQEHLTAYATPGVRFGLNGIATAAVAAEAALKLQRLTGAAVSRRGTFAKAPPEAIDEFLAAR